MKHTLIIATKNPHKFQELRKLLANVGAEIRSLVEFGDLPEIVEDSDTMEGNALKKSSETAHHLVQQGVKGPFIVLADDSGLEVDALGGAPGVYSARFAEYDGRWPDKSGGTAVSPVSMTASARRVTYHDNNVKLLRLLKEVPDTKRGARFLCVIALATDDGREQVAEGVCDGWIIREERGTQGFGYDPIFIPRDYDKTFAELGSDIKDRISHRARALERAKMLFQELMAE